jgi:hypothetical protein
LGGPPRLRFPGSKEQRDFVFLLALVRALEPAFVLPPFTTLFLLVFSPHARV